MSNTTTTDPVAAALAAIRARSEQPVVNAGSLPISHPGVRGLMESAGDVPRLLAALEAILAQHQPGNFVILGALCPKHREHRYFSITSTEAAGVVACQECTASVFRSCTGCGPPVGLDSCPARLAINAKLLGEGSQCPG